MSEENKSLTGVVRGDMANEVRVQTGNNPVRPRKVPVNRGTTETRSNNPIPPRARPKPKK
jgi:hypothetical protein